MEAFTTLGDAIDAIVRFDREKFSTMPEHVQAELCHLASVEISPVDRIVRTAEMLFANRAKLTRNVDRETVARLIEFAAGNGWHGLNEENRAGRISAAMMAEAGGAAVGEDVVPTPRKEFLPLGASPNAGPAPVQPV